jgi:hypothetical protein
MVIYPVEMRELEAELESMLEDKMREVKLAAWEDATAMRAAYWVEIGCEIDICTGRISTPTESIRATA